MLEAVNDVDSWAFYLYSCSVSPKLQLVSHLLIFRTMFVWPLMEKVTGLVFKRCKM